jgi:hypothetical protein
VSGLLIGVMLLTALPAGPSLSLDAPGLGFGTPPLPPAIVPIVDPEGDPDRPIGGGSSTGGVSALIASAVLAAGVLVVGTGAWWDDGLTEFSLRETGFFGEETYAGGSDKAGHMYSSYVSMHLVEPLYEGLGVSRRSAPWWAAAFTFLLWNGFELIDGFTEFGFEYGDVIANTAGIGLGLVTRLDPRLHDTIGMRMAYVPSRDFLANEKTWIKFINDYSGMLFYLDVKAKGVAALLGRDPGLWRYVVGGLVYGTDQYSPVRRRPLRERNFGVHIGLSFAELLRGLGGGDEGVDGLATIFDYYGVPFLGVALMKDLNGGPWFVSFGVANRFETSLGG